MAVGDVYRVRLVSRQFGQEHNQVLHVRTTGPSGMSDAGDAVNTWIASNLAGAQDSTLTYEKIIIDSLIPFGPYFERLVTTPGGLLVGDPLPPVNSAVISWRTAVRGKRKRGRNFFGGLVFTDVVDGQLTTARAAAWQAVGEGLLSALATEGFDLVVWSRTTAGEVPPFSPLSAETVTQAVARSITTSMRTRKIGKGA